MAELLFSNNAHATLAADINASQTTIELAPGKGALFPSPTGAQITKITVQSLAFPGTDIEIMDCVARNIDVLTVQRGAEGTTPRAFSADTAIVQGRITAGILQSFTQSGGVSANVQTYRQNETPVGATLGSIWFDADSNNKVHRWDGAAWVATDDARIVANAAAITTEATTRASADSALSSQITTVSAVASSRNRTFRQIDPPTADALGDIWLDSNDSNKLYRWNGSQWVEASDERIAVNAASIVTEQTARADADTALASSITTVSATANSKNRTFHQASAPTALAVGDLWLDSDDGNKAYRWDGSSWVLTADTRIAANEASITTEASVRAAADGTINARYGVKVNVNGKVSGFGLISEANDGAIVSTFDVLADNFKISNSSGGVLQTPFSVSGSEIFLQNVIVGSTIRQGQTAYDTGVGFWLGSDSGTPKFSLGNSSGNKVTWNGSTLAVTGTLNMTNAVGTFTPTWTGFSTAPTGTLSYIDLGAIVILWRDSSMVGTSNANTMTLSSLPAAIVPSGGVRKAACIVVDAGTLMAGAASLNAGTEVITFSKAIQSGATNVVEDDVSFANSGIKGLPAGWMMIYSK